jgi:hypothetical protein
MATHLEPWWRISGTHAIRSNAVRFVEHVKGRGVNFFRAACAHDLEGVVAKWKDGTEWPTHVLAEDSQPGVLAVGRPTGSFRGEKTQRTASGAMGSARIGAALNRLLRCLSWPTYHPGS